MGRSVYGADTAVVLTAVSLPRLLLGRVQGLLELGFALVREGRLQDLAPHALHLVEHAIRRGVPDQDEQRRAPGGQAVGQFLHELVVDAHVAEGTRYRSR